MMQDIFNGKLIILALQNECMYLVDYFLFIFTEFYTQDF